MRLVVTVFLTLFTFVWGIQEKNEVVLNDKTDIDEASVDYETLIRIFDEDFPDTDPDSLDCTDILGVYLEWTNADYQRADYKVKPEMVAKVRRATSKGPWPKDRKMAHELREHHLARLHGTERERKIANRLRACGCWARLRGNTGTPSKSTDRVAESVITPTRKFKPQVATIQKLAAKTPKLGSVVLKLRNKESPPAHLKSKSNNHIGKDSHDPNSWHQGLEEPIVRSRVPPPLRITDRQGRLHHLHNKPGSLVKETLQALQRHGQHLDAQLADAFAQTLGVERNDKPNDKEKFLIHAWNKNKQSQSGKFITHPFDVNEKPTAIKDDNFDRGTFPLASKFQDKNEDIDTSPTNPSSVQEDSNGYWYIILIGCLLGVCALLAVSLVVVLCRRCRRRKRKRTSDDIDCKFDTEFKEPTVYVSVTSGSLSKQKMSSGKTSGEQPDQDNESATHDTKVDATADDRNDGFKDGTRANGLKTSPDYENVIVPPSYHDVVGAEKSAEFEQHV